MEIKEKIKFNNKTIDLELFITQPERITRETKKMFLIHGTERDSKSLYDVAEKYSKKINTIFIIPKFDLENFNYFEFNFGNLTDNDAFYDKDKSSFEILPYLNKVIFPEIKKYDLWGFSAGCQFVHRQILFNSKNIDNVYACAAGWYTMLDNNFNYPYGVANFKDKEKLLQNLKNCKINVFVGKNDIGSYNVKRNEFVDKYGTTRVERAIEYYKQVKKYANDANFEEFSGIAHEDKKMLKASLDYISACELSR